jgi:hypothetical protein
VPEADISTKPSSSSRFAQSDGLRPPVVRLFEAKAYEIDELAAIYDSAVRNGGTMMTSNEEDLLTHEV